MMDINIEIWGRRFIIGLGIAIGLIILLLFLGTPQGRALFLFFGTIGAIILGLGYAGDVAYEAYQEYSG